MKVALLISGGVDSSVALRLLQEQGHDVTAFYLKIWLEDELASLGNCPWQEDLTFIEQVCAQAGVPLHVVPLQKEYWDTVVAYVLKEVQRGLTPNPDVFCNTFIKFGLFFDYLLKAGHQFDKIASGHYGGIQEISGRYHLVQAPDPIKDQTYFLSYLSQEQLSRIMLPLAGLTKQQVRALAMRFALMNKERKDSQGICFLGKLKFSDFLYHYLGEQKGPIVELETGKIVGEHRGFWYYTIGQRQGLGLAGGPWYVVDKDWQANTVYIARAPLARDRATSAFIIVDCNWFCKEVPLDRPLRIKVRHGQGFHQGIIKHEARGLVVTLGAPDKGIAPGQFAVFYEDAVCLGSGIINANIS